MDEYPSGSAARTRRDPEHKHIEGFAGMRLCRACRANRSSVRPNPPPPDPGRRCDSISTTILGHVH